MAGVIRVVLTGDGAEKALRSFALLGEQRRWTGLGYGLAPVTYHLMGSGHLSVRFRWTKEAEHDPKTRRAGFVEATFKRRLTADEYAGFADAARRRLSNQRQAVSEIAPAADAPECSIQVPN